MGQSTSTTTSRFPPPPLAAASPPDELVVNHWADVDRTDDLPDECLAYIFQFLGAGDRKRCSLVCSRWLHVDGARRHRLSLNAQADIVSSIPSIFTRFDSVTKLALRCDRKSVSLSDEALVMISIRCRNLTRVKLRGCREITDEGISAFAINCRGSLKKLSCGSCAFGARGMNAVLEHCSALEELSIKRLRGMRDGAELIGLPGAAAASSLKSICLKELVNGQCFGPMVIGCEKLQTLKIIRCLGDWDKVLEVIGNGDGSRNGGSCLTEIHLERIQVSDVGLMAISKCANIEVLHIVKAPECSNSGLSIVAENCRQLRKLHVDGWRINRIGDEGLIAIAKQCPNLQELVLIGVNASHLSLAAIAANCQKLERLALCGTSTIGDAEMTCIAAKCVALKKLCIKGCAISDSGIEALAWGCPNLIKVKVKKCRGVSNEVVDWLQERKGSLVVNFDASENEGFDVSGSEAGVESGLEYPVADQVVVAEGPSTSAGRLALFRAKLGHLAKWGLVRCAFSSRSDNVDASDNL